MNEPGKSPPSQRVGVVAIGRNEGERLRACLLSVIAPGRTVVYVDSGSTDDSVRLALDLGAVVVPLDKSAGFTAARARNAGWRHLLEVDPAVEFVQFVDGDCELAEGWIEAALAFLGSNAGAAVACGRLRETRPRRNVFHRLADLEWDTPVGEAKHCGGVALFRARALVEVGGFRDSLIAGEEPELCVRMRAARWTVHRLPNEMARHDVRMERWSQWWKRCVRAGHAYAEGAALHGAPPERHWVRETRSVLLAGIALPLTALALAWPTWGASVVALAGAYALLWWRTYSGLRERLPRGDASIYALHCVAAKLPQSWGAARYWITRARGDRATLIEYQDTAIHTRRTSSADAVLNP